MLHQPSPMVAELAAIISQRILANNADMRTVQVYNTSNHLPPHSFEIILNIHGVLPACTLYIARPNQCDERCRLFDTISVTRFRFRPRHLLTGARKGNTVRPSARLVHSVLAIQGGIHDRVAYPRARTPHALVAVARLGAKHAQVFQAGRLRRAVVGQE